MKIEVITLFADMFPGPLSGGVVGRAIKKGLVKVKAHDMRKWAWNSYGAVDDRPFGGGVGMVIRPDVVDKAIKDVSSGAKVIVLSAKGKRFNQKIAKRLSKEKKLVLVCGRYEGFDQRVLNNMADEVISMGNYILSGGELPAMVMIDTITRLLPGVLGKDKSSREESFSGGKREIEYPQYTRPRDFGGLKVPEVLLSGDHLKIKQWRSKQGAGQKQSAE